MESLSLPGGAAASAAAPAWLELVLANGVSVRPCEQCRTVSGPDHYGLRPLYRARDVCAALPNRASGKRTQVANVLRLKDI